MLEADPLAQLRDIHLPEPVGLWPLAPGWWLLIALVVIAAICLSLYVYRKHRRNRYRRQAKTTLLELRMEFSSEPLQYLRQVNQLLKTTAIAAGKQNKLPDNYRSLAKLSGKSWLVFLDSTGNTSAFTQGPGQILSEGPYSPTTVLEDVTELEGIISHWIAHHQIPQRTVSAC